MIAGMLAGMRGKLLLLLLCGGCCFGQTGFGSPPPPPPPPPPFVTPPFPATGMFAADCMGLCQRSGVCMDERGTPRTPDEASCAMSCSPGGAYTAMPPESLACVSRATCAEFDACTGEAIALMLGRLLGGGPLGGAPPPSLAPPGWPEGFPVVPGGQPMTAPPAGPVRVGLMGYSGSTAAALDASYRGALAAAGWTATASEASPRGAHRFQASRAAASISVSIYDEQGMTLIQTMQL